ncbi:oligosaccharide flippase family protein [Staphylococcus argenteus]|uniref:oligosaccharide flippase family protein n=1 Tax=Staphylococcus argenteus TaxID=985002 RepID=UPI00050527D6|nr:lipopolysaccharide biosynthesis protein [Staphylococcus argenteus]MBE2133300.1 lipopolysaccharide biosynthesis protein [Staphylococcus argenteus]MBE2147391.1 lipopolysaccharide biosynthesis protein [Staphylococcus argenteus]MBE2160889.1 lipopolysaccharide biosynthesis protein [Staphylococcus argenteus]MCG9797001.1 lipopolysaccharide biosynthesis protein [Staphylococcus argenteus]MCG9799462.1 lipopolysaccharide biosynthesis protein [Staphylococcus argenteus]
MKSDSLKANIIYQGLYQLIRTLTPLITIPIISRAFGPTGVGIASFSFNIVQYFLMIASVGVQLYFNRIIAQSVDNKQQLSQQFWDIFISKLLLSATVLVIYIATITLLIDDYYMIFLLQGIYIIGAALDISWFYAGTEKFKIPSLSNIVASGIVLGVVVIFVKDQSDLSLYVFTIAIVTVLNQIPLFIYLKRYIIFVSINWRQVWQIFRSSLAYLLPNGQLNLYTSISCVVLGLLGTYQQVGIFSNAFNILTVAIIMINTFDLVMIPRITKMSTHPSHSLTKTLADNMNIQLMLTIPMVFGLIAIMPSFYLWFFGDAFASTVPLMTILAILVLIIPLNMLISRQYLLIVNKIRLYNASITIGAVVNIVLCLILIYLFGIYGAAIARLVTEFILLIWRFIDITQINVKLNVLSAFQCIISAVIMFIVLGVINHYLSPTIYATIFLIVIGIVVYILLMMAMKNYYLWQLLKHLRHKTI